MLYTLSLFYWLSNGFVHMVTGHPEKRHLKKKRGSGGNLDREELKIWSRTQSPLIICFIFFQLCFCVQPQKDMVILFARDGGILIQISWFLVLWL